MAVQNPPAEFSAYSASIHVIQHAKGLSKGPNRHISGDIIRECIEDGTPRKVNRHTWRFETDIDGVEFATVVATDEHEIVTAHPVSVDHDVASDTGRWTPDDLADIEAAIRYHERKEPYDP
ncbi:hypothetical protein C453_12891 [Haloferax elongans ATCC BAA-1513]|uniref:Uncharacterized protein n=1 Tax=Haloferax elongans ATCC BAA-1513 TaxID=1230453 RepID=M0HKX8_HALEO|nr:hypothetical protein [Haloferax elongans]ELZ84443.1 hypothetical protein C453_12891 [Haloferax elongans ATCC BAA-1513]